MDSAMKVSPKVDISVDTDGVLKVMLDGHNVARFLRSLSINVDSDGRPMLTIFYDIPLKRGQA